ncbi:MAG: L,D-transpeptidase Cds6 family protein [Stenotrophobium sp.]
MPRTFFSTAALAALLLLSFRAQAIEAPGGAPTMDAPETELLQGIEQLRKGDTHGALKTLGELTQQQPNFLLAHMFYSEVLASISGTTENIVNDSSTNTVLQDLAEEARLRIAAEKATPAPGSIPSDVLQLSSQHPYVILVDLPKARLYLLKNDSDGKFSLVRQMYAGIGRNGYGKETAGDLKTPVGVYHITSWIPGKSLPGLYGAGAFPLSYPNLWDDFKKRGGSGIWLHGVPPDTYVRAPRSSEGCVTMANDDLLALRPYVEAGQQTPVILSDDLSWKSAKEIRAEKDAFLKHLEAWRHQWSAVDTDGYLSFYDHDFITDGMNYAAFSAYKKRVNRLKKYIHIKLSDIDLYRYPGSNGSLMLVEFTMDYRSNNYDSVTRKQQFWKRGDDGHWKIFREAQL